MAAKVYCFVREHWLICRILSAIIGSVIGANLAVFLMT